MNAVLAVRMFVIPVHRTVGSGLSTVAADGTPVGIRMCGVSALVLGSALTS